MPKYRYTVVNQENKELNGTIGATDELLARQELNELGFSVLSMEAISDQQQPTSTGEGLSVFEFAAIDKNKKHITGTIQSIDRLSAYKLLIGEYALDVKYLIDSSLAEDQKEKERKKGIYDLQNLVTEEQMLKQKKESSDEKDLKAFAHKQEALKTQIDFVLKKVEAMLNLYGNDMKPETKENIRRRVDKILRIKTSTNLDYVRNSAEELLNFLQKEELFINEAIRLKERTKMVVEAKSMMMQLRHGKAKSNLKFANQLRQWRKEHITDNPSPSFAEKIIDSLISILIGRAPINPEILQIKQELLSLNGQIWQYLQLYFQAPSPEFKAETRDGLKKLWRNRKNLKQKLKTASQAAILERKKLGEQSALKKFSLELFSLSGWMLFFYLIYYFIAIYAVSKNFGQPETPHIFYIFRSHFLKYFLATLLLFHGALGIKIYFFKRNEIATLIITPIFLLSALMIYLNF